MATDPQSLLQNEQFQKDLQEMKSLEECALTATTKILAVSAISATGMMIYRYRQGHRTIGLLFTGLGAAILSACVTWNVWGRQCESEFLTSEGRMAARGRRVLKEMIDQHPLLIEYEQKHQEAYRDNNMDTDAFQPYTQSASDASSSLSSISTEDR